MHFRRVCRPVAAWLFALAVLGCGSDRYIVIGTARAPSTSGFVEVTGTSDASTRLKVRMEQLHAANSLDPAFHAYVVWFEGLAEGKGTPSAPAARASKLPAVRAGSLRYSPDDRVGELQATSPYRKFVVKITAEANDKPSAPGPFVVATQEISTPD